MIYCSVIVIKLIVQLGEEFDEKTADMRDVTTLAVFEGGKLVTLEKVPTSLSLSLSLTAFFAQKTPFLGQFLMDFFLTERGGTPPPLHGRSVPENLTEKS